MQVIPIYGRGGDDKDPRKNKDLPPLELDTIPSRPAGQRPALTQVCVVASWQLKSCLRKWAADLSVPSQRHTLPPGIAVNSHLGNIIPTFFNFAQGQGRCFCKCPRQCVHSSLFLSTLKQCRSAGAAQRHVAGAASPGVPVAAAAHAGLLCHHVLASLLTLCALFLALVKALRLGLCTLERCRKS